MMRRLLTVVTLGTPFLCACGSEDGNNGPEPGPSSFAGKTYVAQPEDFSSNFGYDIAGSVPAFLLQVAESPSGYDVTVGTALRRDSASEPLEQQLCSPTSTVSAVSNPYPDFQLGPVDLPIYLRHADPEQEYSIQTKLYDLTITNILPPEGGTAEGTLSAYLDVREIFPIFPAVGPSRDADKTCSYIEANTEDAMCSACPDGVDSGPGNYCFFIEAVYLTAEVAPGVTVQPVTMPPASCEFENKP